MFPKRWLAFETYWLRAQCHKRLPSLLLVAMLLLFACAQQPVQLPSPPVTEESLSQDYLIGPEDVLEVMVWKNADLSREVTVRPDGKISLTLIGDVQASGYTIPQLTRQIAEKLEDYYQESPQVSVIVKEVKSYTIYILGEVKKQGKYTVKTGTTFLQAIALAEGFDQFAASNKIIVRRRGNNGEDTAIRIRYKDVVAGMEKNIVLKPGDTIIVP